MLINLGSPKQNPAALLPQPLLDSDIHVWCASLDRPDQELPNFAGLLSADEKARAEKFHFAKDRRRYIIGRGLLRVLLSNYLEMESSAFEFTYGLHGKPALESHFNGRVFEFNLSHSRDKVIYIFNWDQPIGIDIEYDHPLKDLDDFAFQFFTPNECNFIQSLPMDQKRESFFKIWTCKEAFLKANGSGLTSPINEVEVALTTDKTASLTSIGGNREQAAHWRLELFTPLAGYQSALAIEKQGGKITFHQINDISI